MHESIDKPTLPFEVLSITDHSSVILKGSWFPAIELSPLKPILEVIIDNAAFITEGLLLEEFIACASISTVQKKSNSLLSAFCTVLITLSYPLTSV